MQRRLRATSHCSTIFHEQIYLVVLLISTSGTQQFIKRAFYLIFQNV